MILLYVTIVQKFDLKISSFSDTFAGRSNPPTQYSKDADDDAESNRRSLNRSYETEFSEEENEFSDRNDSAFDSDEVLYRDHRFHQQFMAHYLFSSLVHKF